VLTLMVENS